MFGGFTPRLRCGTIMEMSREGSIVVTKETELLIEIAELRSEVERLRKQLAETRRDRAELSQMIVDMMPPIELPSEDEMRAQMKHLVSSEQLMRELQLIRESHKNDPRPSASV